MSCVTGGRQRERQLGSTRASPTFTSPYINISPVKERASVSVVCDKICTLYSWWTPYDKMDIYEDGSTVGQCFKLERCLNFGPLNDDDDYSFTKKKAVRVLLDRHARLPRGPRVTVLKFTCSFMTSFGLTERGRGGHLPTHLVPS
ncbi:hypothetical protein Pmani_006739 [Petrolisthes manimaculis]|uniref:Uncharacterized protein n=1 Tax=Petrolisthes manimaculis TaxID=1843537 RepID=A0AAE1Q9W9_9EUCA|nr:hypothetical protein Pmani_006739 [Petrolisthes manimaculis]